MRITIFSAGCYKCVELEQPVAEALRTLKIADAQVERISGERLIRRHMALDAIPGMGIDGRLVCERQVPELVPLTSRIAQARAYEKGRAVA